MCLSLVVFSVYLLCLLLCCSSQDQCSCHTDVSKVRLGLRAPEAGSGSVFSPETFCVVYYSDFNSTPSTRSTVLLYSASFPSLKFSTFIRAHVSFTASSFTTPSFSFSTSPVCTLCRWMQTADKKTQVSPDYERQWRKRDTGNVVKGLGKSWCGLIHTPEHWGYVIL